MLVCGFLHSFYSLLWFSLLFAPLLFSSLLFPSLLFSSLLFSSLLFSSLLSLYSQHFAIGFETGAFPMESSKLTISLDAAVGTFLDPSCLLLSLKGGKLHLCHLVSDGRSLRSITVAKACASVLASCVSKNISNDVVMLHKELGSRSLISCLDMQSFKRPCVFGFSVGRLSFDTLFPKD
jgi:hypothetical protein